MRFALLFASALFILLTHSYFAHAETIAAETESDAELLRSIKDKEKKLDSKEIECRVKYGIRGACNYCDYKDELLALEKIYYKSLSRHPNWKGNQVYYRSEDGDYMAFVTYDFGKLDGFFDKCK